MLEGASQQTLVSGLLNLPLQTQMCPCLFMWDCQRQYVDHIFTGTNRIVCSLKRMNTLRYQFLACHRSNVQLDRRQKSVFKLVAYKRSSSKCLVVRLIRRLPIPLLVIFFSNLHVPLFRGIRYIQLPKRIEKIHQCYGLFLKIYRISYIEWTTTQHELMNTLEKSIYIIKLTLK